MNVDKRAVMEWELTEARRELLVSAGIEPYPWEGPEPSDAPPEPIAFQSEAEPAASDAVVLRDLAQVLERGGQPYGWIPNRMRTIADRLEALVGKP